MYMSDRNPISRLPITMSILLVIVAIVSFQAPTNTFALEDERYVKCKTSLFQCGDMEGIGYPFWGESRPSYCGYPDLQLTCRGPTTMMSISQLDYRVFSINEATGELRVARADYLGDICPRLHVNTSFNSNIYTFDAQTVTIYYQCPPKIQGFASSNVGISDQIYCNINSTNCTGYCWTMNSNFNFDMCNDSVVVRIDLESFWTLKTKTQPTQEDLMLALGKGFSLQFYALALKKSLCSLCELSGGACGYNQSTGAFTCYCPDQAYASMCEGSGTPIQSPSPVDQSPNPVDKRTSNQVMPAKGRSNQVSLAIGLAVAGTFIVGSIVLAWWLLTLKGGGKARPPFAAIWQQNTKEDEKIETFIMNYCSLLPSRYSYSDIKKITNSFTDKLGEGGFGGVYKGKLSDGRLVAVKVLTKPEGDGEDFINEVASIGRTSHVNIVTLLGYCFERRKRALIYQYMPNGSLDRFIYHQRSQKMEWLLDWKTLYDIAIGIARGLEYLHSGCNARILHLDIKPHNILLDEDLCPKICDFGMAKLCKGKESKVSMLGTRGTVGYIAPEVISRSFGEVSSKSDVYSYGMMVLEMVGARRNFDNGVSRTSEKYFPDWIYQQLEQGKASRLCDDITQEEEETARKMILVGLWCIQTNPSNRPSMAKVIEMLEGSLQSLQTPPKPYLHSPKRSLKYYSSISSKAPYTCSQRAETEDLPLEVVGLQVE